MKTIKCEPLEIPEAAVGFARNVSILCDEYGVEHCELKFRLRVPPGYRDRQESPGQVIYPDSHLVMTYSSRDGRGRPRKKLALSLSAQTTLKLIDEPDTYS